MTSLRLARGALIVALALVLQALRLILPLPPLLSTLLIGTLVHMMLVLALRLNGRLTAVLLGILLPLTAYLQGQLLLPFLIPVVWSGNLLFVALLIFLKARQMLQFILPPLAKAVVMGAAAYLVISFVQIDNQALRRGIMLGMSLMQLATGVLGVLLAQRILRALPEKF